MSVGRYGSVCPAYALKRSYQGNLFLGTMLASLIIIAPPLLLTISNSPPVTVHIGDIVSPAGGPAGERVDINILPPGGPTVQPLRRVPVPQGDRFGMIPVLVPDSGEGAGQIANVSDRHTVDTTIAAGESGGWPGGKGKYLGDYFPPDTNTYSYTDPVQKIPELVWMRYPDFPELARKSGTRGNVVLQILVGRDGKPINSFIVSEDPENFGFGEKALEAVKTAVFNPALQNNYPVQCWVRLPVEFIFE